MCFLVLLTNFFSVEFVFHDRTVCLLDCSLFYENIKPFSQEGIFSIAMGTIFINLRDISSQQFCLYFSSMVSLPKFQRKPSC